MGLMGYGDCGNGCQAKTDAFVKKYANDIINALQGTGIFFSTLVAQKSLESDYGLSDLAVKYNNFGGIKYGNGVWGASGPTPPLDTTEYVNGRLVHTKAEFAAYPDPKTAFESYVKILQDPSKKYTLLGVFTAPNPIKQLELIVKGGYTTTPLNKYLDSRMKGQIDYITDKFKIGKIS